MSHIHFIPRLLLRIYVLMLFTFCSTWSLTAQDINLSSWNDAKYLIPLCISLDNDFDLIHNPHSPEIAATQAFTGLSRHDLLLVANTCRTIATAMSNIGEQARSEQKRAKSPRLPIERAQYFNRKLQSIFLAASSHLGTQLTEDGRGIIFEKLQDFRSSTTGATLGGTTSN